MNPLSSKGSAFYTMVEDDGRKVNYNEKPGLMYLVTRSKAFDELDVKFAAFFIILSFIAARFGVEVV